MAIDVQNPRTGTVDYRIEPLGTAELSEIIGGLRQAQPVWAAMAPGERAGLLGAFAGKLVEHAEPIVGALMQDTGRLGLSKVEFGGILGTIERWANLAPKLIAETEAARTPAFVPGVEPGSIQTGTHLVPYPVVGVISPWNFPMLLGLLDAIPALAAGSAVIVKPSEVTPRWAAAVRAAVAEVPVLSDVFAIVDGDGSTGAALVPLADYVVFTGSVATGRKVAVAAAEAFVPISLELGGKDPMVVLGSADVKSAAATALRGSVVATGQACQSIEHVLVDRAIADEFVAELVAAAEQVRINHPDPTAGEIGPFIFPKQAAIVQRHIDDAVDRGAKVLTGGKVEIIDGGSYLRPTILVDVPADAEVLTEETFGPVIPVTVFDTVDEAVERANATRYGLSAAVLGGTAEEAAEVGRRINAGTITINDSSLTTMVWDAEEASFGYSGIGPSRMGESGLFRFFRRQALIEQSGPAWPLAAYSEEAIAAMG